MWTRRNRRAAAVVAVVAIVMTPGACSDNNSDSSSTNTTSPTVSAVERTAVPAANLSEELSGGDGISMGVLGGPAIPDGYVEQEFAAAGTATDYDVDGKLSADGDWEFTPGTTADYRTRVVVRRPKNPADASGTVIVEWLNVSGGLDTNPDYASLEPEIVRAGHIWVGVSAQLIGVEGGPVLVGPPGSVSKGLTTVDPERYGTLEHPGDGYSFDIFTQVARSVRDGGPAVGDVKPEVVIAAGESQSALALTTYYNGVQPLTQEFDGFFVHSRASVALPLVGPGESADLAGAMMSSSESVVFRSDLDGPILELQTEGDVIGALNSFAARQPDTDTFRLWEVAGTAHVDATLLGPVAAALDCGVPINDGPMQVVTRAAFRALDHWVRTGEAPPRAARLEIVDGSSPAIKRDSDGIALGGIRTPPVDVPVEMLSGEPGPKDDMICLLMGSTTPLAPARIAELYKSSEDYLEKYGQNADVTIKDRFALEEDREALMAYADPSLVKG